MIDIQHYRLPRAVEEGPHGPALSELFRAAQAAGSHALPEIALDASVQAVLQRSLRTGRLKRGFETTLDVLANERRGLENLQQKTGTDQKARVSRLILISSDVSERLRREIARALERHAPRVLALSLRTDSAELGRLLYGPDTIVKVLLLDHKEAVAEMLIAAAQPKM